jgi:glycosyltransferase involved in cell wall biosynthesis
VINSVSTIIPNFNYGRFLNKTIDSVLEQTHSHIEIIVIDNGSTDNSREVLESYGDRIKTIFQTNLGQAVARNVGISNASGDFIALLDADDYWEPSKIERQFERVDKEFQFIYTGFRQFESNSGVTLQEVHPIFQGDCSLSFVNFPTRAIIPGGESSALITREIVKKVGDFNPDLNSASGRDFFRRCSAKTKFAFVDDSLINYRRHNLNMSLQSKSMMSDTAEAYRILFEDPEWQFAMKYRKSCLSKLHWSFFKTFVKKGDLLSAIPELVKTIAF